MPSRQFRMILPKYDNSMRRIGTDTLRDASKEVAREFGGVTVVPSVLGCFVADDGELECEENMVIEVTLVEVSTERINEARQFMHDLARRSGVTLGQESIMLQEETDTVTSFVMGRRKAAVSSNIIEADFFKRLMD